MKTSRKFSLLFVLSALLAVVYVFVTSTIHTLGTLSFFFWWMTCFATCAGICALWFKWCSPRSPMMVLPFAAIVAMIVYEFELMGIETTREGILVHGLMMIVLVGNIVFGAVILAEAKRLVATK